MVWNEKYMKYAYRDTEPFIKIQNDSGFYFVDYFEEEVDVGLYACPKCWTVQMVRINKITGLPVR